MKTVLEYLQEQKNMACHNLLCYSKTYCMDTPKEGMELAFAEAKRDIEIVEELIITAQDLDACSMLPQGASQDNLRRVFEKVGKRRNSISKYGHMDSLDILCSTTLVGHIFVCRVNRNGVTVSFNNIKLTYFSNDLLRCQGSKVSVQLNPESMGYATVRIATDNKPLRVSLSKLG